MKRLMGKELADILSDRPALKAEMEKRGVEEVNRINDVATDPESERAGKRILILIARRLGQDYLMMSTKGTKGKTDKVVTWLHSGVVVADESTDERYIKIDKRKVGRPRRELTEEERGEIKARRKAGDTINQISRAMHLGTRRVMDALESID
ncbi:MAG: hypothetical protein IJQ78_05300 [Selenomonadaceae bacterium]|nr:hypothetical protein [Selenomonadaceae bacterium]